MKLKLVEIWEGDLTPSEMSNLRGRLKYNGFQNYRRFGLFYNGKDELVAYTDANESGVITAVITHRGWFYRSYQNRVLPITMIDVGDDYIDIVVQNGLNRPKRIDCSKSIN